METTNQINNMPTRPGFENTPSPFSNKNTIIIVLLVLLTFSFIGINLLTLSGTALSNITPPIASAIKNILAINTLNERLSGHKYDYKRYKNNKYHYVSCFEVMEDPTYRIMLLEEFPCSSRDELLMREGQYQRDMECVNKYQN